MMGINANAIKCEVNKNVEKMNNEQYIFGAEWRCFYA